MMRNRKLLSLLIVLSIIASIVSIPNNFVSAKDIENWDTVSANRGKISYFYLGKSRPNGSEWDFGTQPTATTPQEIPNDLDVGDMVYIGVAVSDLSKVQDLFKPEDSGVRNGGVYKYVVSMAFDNRYLRNENIGGEDGFNASINLYKNSKAPELIKSSYDLGISNASYSATSTRETSKIDTDHVSDAIIQSELLSSVAANEARLFKNQRGSYAPLGDDPVLLGVFGFEIYNKPTPGTKVLQGALSGDRFSIAVNFDGSTATKWISNVADEGTARAEADSNLKNYFTLTTPDGSAVSDGVIDLFPASSSDKLASLKKTADATKALTGYIEGTKFDPAGLTIVPVKSESGDQTAIAPTATDFKDLKFYLDAAGKDETTLDKTREITKDTELATTDNGKHLYVAYTLDSVTKVLDLGAITVAAQSVSSIAINTDKTTFGGTEKSYFTSDTIQNVFTKSPNPDRLVVTITYNNGKKKDVAYPNAYTDGTTTYEAFSANDLELYRYANDNYTPVTDTMKFGNGTTGGIDTFYVAVKSKAGDNNDVASVDEAFKKAITATVVKDGVVISDPSPADPTKKFAGKDYKLTYGEGYPITLDNLTFMSRKESEAASTATKTTIAELGNNVVYYIADAPAPGQPAPKYNADGSTQFIPYQSPMRYRAADHQGKTVYAVPADTKDTATPIAIGVLATRNIAAATTGNTISPANTASLTYGDALTKVLHKDGTPAVETQIEVTYNNGDKETFKWDNTEKNFIKPADATEGTPELTLLGNGTGNEGVTMRYNGAPVTDASATILTPAASNFGKISFTVGSSSPTTILESDSLSVAKKTAKISLTPTTSAPSKTYDGGTGLPTGKFVNETIADTLASDAALIAKVEPSGLSYTYDSKAVGTTRRIEVTGTPAVAAKGGGATEDELTEINTKYNFVLDGVTAIDSKNYVTDALGTILAKTLTVTSVPTLTGNDAVEVGQTDNLTGTYTLALNTQNSDIVAGDTVSVKFGYDYTEADKTQAGTPNVKVTFNGEGLGLSGADAANYTLNTDEFPTVKGTVANKKLASITVLPGQTGKKDYMYPDTKLDLSDWKVQLNYQGASAGEPISVSEFLQQKGVITFKDKDGTNQTINSANYNKVIADPDVTLGYGTTDLTFVWDGDDEHKGTSSVTNKKKPIRLSDIKFSPSKVYGQDDANATKAYNVPEGTFVGEDGAKVKVAYDVEFTDSDAGTSNRSATIKNITLAADGEDAANTYQNYEIVDGEGTPITPTTTTTVSDATIANGSQPAPDEPDVTVDPKTNTIIISGPLGDDIEYSIDGTNWQDEPIFTDLDLGKTYPVQARVKAKDNYDPSPVSTTRETTYKYHVRAFKKNADITTAKPIAEIYTNTEKVNSDSEMNSDVFTTKPSRWKAYFTDPATTEKIEYPYTMKAETILYMTQSSTGGGGGGTGGTSYYTVKFNAATNGTISEGKASVNVDSGATLTAEEIPTISPKTGYAFVGWSTDGKETVDPTTVKITKATTFTALYEESKDEPKPTATPAPTTEPKPTDAPVIDKNFMKPYASGYEDQSFRPDNNITRAELASMIARLSYQDDLPDNTFSADFPDVAADNWANKYIGYLQNLDVLSGYEDGTFRPNDLVTRGEISSVIARAQKLDIMPYDGAFEDVSDEDWAKDYIQTLVENGIASGYEDNTFGPYNPLTRAETVTMINHVLTPSTAVVTYTPSDVTGHWAASEILLAVNEREPK